MNAPAKALSESHDVSAKVTQMLQTRTKTAIQRYGDRVRRATERTATDLVPKAPVEPWHLWTSGARYAVDAAQRSILLLDTLRQRGNNFLEHERQGLPPVLRFEYEMVMDGPLARAPGQLRAAAHRSADGRHGRRAQASLRHHRSARRPRPGHRRLQGRLAGRRRAARRPSGLLRRLLPEPEPGQTLLDVSQRGARVRARACARCTRTRPSPRSSATARQAGRR